MNKTLLSGLVLAGGRSSRMGKDKGLIVYHERPQREHLFNLLSKHCDQVYTSCYSEQDVSPGLRPLVDEYDLESPLNGILTAFGKHPQSAWLIVAVDMPYVNDGTLALLIDRRDQKKVATCFYNSDEKLPEPLLTLWEPHAYPLLLKFVESGNVSPRDFLSTNAVHLIYPPDSKILQNFNFPNQLPS